MLQKERWCLVYDKRANINHTDWKSFLFSENRSGSCAIIFIVFDQMMSLADRFP